MSGPPPAGTCPSGRCRPGTLLIGLVGADGGVRYLGRPAQIDHDFVAAAGRGRTPEGRFRFAEACSGARCGQWTGSACGLPEALDGLAGDDRRGESSLPACGIRATCVWFRQRRARACRICPSVVHSPAR